MEQVVTANYQHWHLDLDSNQILWFTFDKKNATANTLNEETLKEFDQILNSVSQNTQLKGLVIRSGKTSGFIAGADISQFEKLKSASEATQLIRSGQAIFNKLESLPIKTLALIEGFCLGGGLELALACDIRVGEDSTKTRLGLPEVKLGIQPGWGGTVRLPRKVGIFNSMDLILSGRLITAKAAKKIGLINEVIPKRLLEKAVRDILLNEKTTVSQQSLQKIYEWNWVRPLIGKIFYAQLNKKVSKKHYPAPFKIVENWVQYGSQSRQSMDIEAQSIGELLVTDTAKNLTRVFFLQEQLKAQSKKIKTEIKHVHVIGAGVMGGDIAAWCAFRGLTVTLQDQAPKLIGNAIKRAYNLAQKKLKEPHLVTAMMDRLIPAAQGEGIGQADIIIEAITEKLEAKQDLFKMLEQQAKPTAVLATNTSTIPLEEIGAVMKQPNRLVGIHFFNPVAQMPLVEVVQGSKTSQASIDMAIALTGKIDKLPVVVKSSPGFLVNRILLPYMLEAVTLLEEGIPAHLIDCAAVEFGMPMGPIELADTVGLDVCLAALEKLQDTVGGTIPNQLKEMVSQGHLGRKSGQGFYEYHQGKAKKTKRDNSEDIPQDVSMRLTLRLLNEAVACWREKIVEDKNLLDAGCIFGFGFPPFRGGPIHYIESQGIDGFVQQLDDFSTKYSQRFAADPGWKQLGELHNEAATQAS